MKTFKKLHHLCTAVAIISMFIVLLVGCSGGSSSGAGTPSSTLVVSGVAAAGAPIIGNAYLKDSANHAIGPVPLGTDGSFSFDVTGLTPPFYLLAVGHVGLTDYLLYSVTTSSSGIANINPLTNVIVAAAAGGTDPAIVYGDPAAHFITKENLDKAITALQKMLGPLLAEYVAGDVNPISDSFTADHTKLDKVFDIIAITVDSSGSDVLVVVTDITGDVIAEASTGDLKTPTTSLDPANIPKDVLSIGADRLKNTQNSDGGWEWENPDTDPATGIPSPYNTLGVTAQGLLDAYKITKNNNYLTACIKTYNLLLSNSTNSNTSIHKIRGTDITFLVELSEVTGDPKYADFAKTRYQTALSELGGGTATGFAGYVRDIRKSQSLPALISWDINLYIQGVLALDRYYSKQGFDVKAADMAEVIYNSLYVANDLDFTATNQNSYWLSYTGAIEAFTTTGLHLDKRDSLKLALVASQQSNGHFPENGGDSVFQTTAYAVMALLKVGENVAAKKGVKYLVTNQSPNGGWVEYPTALPPVENTEVTSEAIQAIYNFKTPSSSSSVVTYVRPSSLNNFANTGLGYDQDMNAPVGNSTTGAPGFGTSSLFSNVTGTALRKYTTLRISPKLVLKTDADVLLSDIQSISFWTKQKSANTPTWYLKIYTMPSPGGYKSWYTTRLNTKLYSPTVTDWQLNSTNDASDHPLKFNKINDTSVSEMTLDQIIALHGTESILYMDIAAGQDTPAYIVEAYLDGVTIKTTKGNIVLDLTD